MLVSAEKRGSNHSGSGELRRRGRDDRGGVVYAGNGEDSELTGTDHSFGEASGHRVEESACKRS